jgi:dienelactone hydrolase
MKRCILPRLAGALIILASALGPASSQQNPGAQESEDGYHQNPGPQEPEAGPSRRQLWLLPIPGERLLMHAIVLRPPGPGPFPLAVINHGSIQSAEIRERYPLREYPIASQWFLDRGYAVVLPLRPGHGETGGPYFEDQGRCDSPDYSRAGLRTADSIEAALTYMRAQPFVRSSGIVVAGHSAGGWGALALASRNTDAVQAVINFAGGRGGHSEGKANSNCAADRLIATAGEFGRSARIPTLWLYSENDAYFAPALSKDLHQAFRAAGGTADYHLLPPFGTDGHGLINSEEAAGLWGPIADKFLAENRSSPRRMPSADWIGLIASAGLLGFIAFAFRKGMKMKPDPHRRAS